MTCLFHHLTDFTRERIAIPNVTLDESAMAEKGRQRLTRLGYDKVFKDDFGSIVGIPVDEQSDFLLFHQSFH